MKEAPKEVKELSDKICDLVDEYEETLDVSQVIGVLSTLTSAFFIVGTQE